MPKKLWIATSSQKRSLLLNNVHFDKNFQEMLVGLLKILLCKYLPVDTCLEVTKSYTAVMYMYTFCE